jgi:hypothetical protein
MLSARWVNHGLGASFRLEAKSLRGLPVPYDGKYLLIVVVMARAGQVGSALPVSLVNMAQEETGELHTPSYWHSPPHRKDEA